PAPSGPVRHAPPAISTIAFTIPSVYIFFFTHPPTPETYTLSLHDALPIWRGRRRRGLDECADQELGLEQRAYGIAEDLLRYHRLDRKSTRLNSSHVAISYAVFCLKKKKINKWHTWDVLKVRQSKQYMVLLE